MPRNNDYQIFFHQYAEAAAPAPAVLASQPMFLNLESPKVETSRFVKSEQWYQAYLNHSEYAGTWVALRNGNQLVATHLSIRRVLELLDEQAIPYQEVVVLFMPALP